MVDAATGDVGAGGDHADSVLPLDALVLLDAVEDTVSLAVRELCCRLGIAGGSRDVGNMLVVLNEAWGLHWPAERLELVAAELGSDVPLFVKARASLYTGRGEIMVPLRPVHGLFAVLIIPPLGCPTKAVYQAFDAGHRHVPSLPKTDWAACARATAEELSGMLVNDLEPAAFFVAPELATVRTRAEAASGRRVHMTGSGSTLFVLCGSGAEAGEMQAKLAAGLGEECGVVAVRVG